MSHEKDFPLIFERSRPGRTGYRFPPPDVPAEPLERLLPAHLLRETPPAIPEVSEVEVVRHYTRLSTRNYGVDLGIYPLGSCTMKYNPKLNEEAARLEGFAALHPLQPEEGAQGTLELMARLTEALCEVTGMEAGTLQPFAGALGELTGLKLFGAWFAARGETGRKRILVPDSAHGTNPASAALAGFEVVEVPSDERGLVRAESLAPYLDDRLAGIMLTNPNTLGLFEREIVEIARRVHGAGGLLYYDGANLNAIMGRCRPGDMGFDVVHLNLHKTFSTPHGGGGPGAGPVLVCRDLAPFLPVPDIGRVDGVWRLVSDRPQSIGRVAGFYGNVGVLVRAYAYLLTMGRDGLRAASDRAVLNARYLQRRLEAAWHAPYGGACMHEFVLSARPLKERCGVSALDVAKRLLDFGVHPPTVYFPLIVAEALMVEPTETESRESLDDFADLLLRVAREAEEKPELLKEAPTRTPVKRIDEVRAARQPVLRWTEGRDNR